ncbi:MAG: prephenate dehydrogenase [Spirochaetales bacterium]|jgi:prephenate dehydrogenase|nr:prephenate dehydrogenase [Spirochaetales bacterium]
MRDFARQVYAFVGLGLMGGAFVRALRPVLTEARKHGEFQALLSPRSGKTQSGKTEGPGPAQALAFDADPQVLIAAAEEGLIDRGFSEAGEMLALSDVVFLCLNPRSAEFFLRDHREEFKPGSLITDICGIKRSLLPLARELSAGNLDFIPGHPMAGSEKEGFANSRAFRFTGRNYILTPLPENRPENLAFLRDLIYRLGFSRIVETSAEDHDEKIAFTSQLCHVIAAALIDSSPDASITRFGGGSFEDLTRIAEFNASMWAELFTGNRDKLTGQIDRFAASLDRLRLLIDQSRGEELQNLLAGIREKRIKMESPR